MKEFKIIFSIAVILGLQLLFTHVQNLNATPVKEYTHTEMLAEIMAEINTRKDLQILYDEIKIKALDIRSYRLEEEDLDEEYKKLRKKERQLREDQAAMEHIIILQEVKDKVRLKAYYKQFDDIAAKFEEIKKRRAEIRDEIKLCQQDLRQIEYVFKQISKSKHIESFLKSHEQYWMN